MAAQLWWIIHKDFVTECRARQIGPAMLLMGVVVGLLFALQLQVVPQALTGLIGSQYWLTVFLGGILALDSAFLAERETGTGSGLRSYPVAPHTIFLAKFITNVLMLGVLQLVLLLLFTTLAGVRFFEYPWRMLLLGLLGNLAITSQGTLLAAIASGMRQGRGLLTVLMLPLQIPVVISAAEATRLLLENDSGAAWYRWIQLLAAFAIVFIAAGVVLYEFVMEE